METLIRQMVVTGEGPFRPSAIQNPSWNEVAAALTKMDRGHPGNVELLGSNNTELVTIFGEPGRFVVGIWEDDETVSHLLAAVPVDDEFGDVAWTSFPPRFVVRDFSLVVEVVRFFYEHGKLLPGASFEREEL
jgi:hypothetical protein